VKRIKAFIVSKNLPHLLFAGSPGTGKTTTALVVARELYGKDGIRGNFLELNASDDRGIDVIRNQIKEFAKLKSLADIPYKIICLMRRIRLQRMRSRRLGGLWRSIRLRAGLS
jgi:replication factor C small subunit